MKLLLTSAGITNTTTARALTNLAGPIKHAKIAFIPTAANVEAGNKDWFFAQIDNLRQHGATWIDVVDISAPGIDWPTRLAEADILFVSGGNTFHLLHHMRVSGFADWLQEQGQEKVYVGVSAGSIVMTPTIRMATTENLTAMTNFSGLDYVNFEIAPHCDQARFATVERFAEAQTARIFAIDDDSAVAITDENSKQKISAVSEGEWRDYDFRKK